jgi:hypothetical protein
MFLTDLGLQNDAYIEGFEYWILACPSTVPPTFLSVRSDEELTTLTVCDFILEVLRTPTLLYVSQLAADLAVLQSIQATMITRLTF